jgi:hypothetical protein
MSKRKSEPFTAVLAFASIVALVGLGIAVPAFAQHGSLEKLRQMKLSGTGLNIPAAQAGKAGSLRPA